MSIRSKIKASMNEFWTLSTMWYSLFLPCTPVFTVFPWNSGYYCQSWYISVMIQCNELSLYQMYQYQNDTVILFGDTSECRDTQFGNIGLKGWSEVESFMGGFPLETSLLGVFKILGFNPEYLNSVDSLRHESSSTQPWPTSSPRSSL